MKRVIKDLYGSWILFFHYVKWPVFLGLPVMYFYVGYRHNYIMDIFWLYSLYEIYNSFRRPSCKP